MKKINQKKFNNSSFLLKSSETYRGTFLNGKWKADLKYTNQCLTRTAGLEGTIQDVWGRDRQRNPPSPLPKKMVLREAETTIL